MLESLHWVGALCTSGPALHGGLLLGLFIAGAAGSVVHCGPMCGAFVLGQVTERMARLPPHQLCEWRRVSNGLLLPYHLGRLTTYAALGGSAAGTAAAFARFPWFAQASGALLALAALIFLAHALGRILPAPSRAPKAWSNLIGLATSRIRRGSVTGEYFMGAALGLLPCGFLYAAIAAAAASDGALMGAASMLAFGLGTVPILMVIGIAGHAAGRRWNRAIAMAAPALMAANAGVLLLLAWQRMT
jgi:uncharacterized protein